MKRCERDDILYLDPRPVRSELSTIYPPDYHAYEFTEERFGLSYAVRRRLEKRRLLNWMSQVPNGGVIVDVGSGDGFHLGVIREYGDPTWGLVAVEPDGKAVELAEKQGFEVHQGFIEDLNLEPDQFDFAIMVMVIEHVDDPTRVLSAVRRVLKPGGRVGIVTDNIHSLDSRFGRHRHWGGYHFPRHFQLFSAGSLSALAAQAGLEVERMETMVSPVNWTYTVHNALADRGAPPWLRRRFTLGSPMALAGFTMIDSVANWVGRGALLRAVLQRPAG